MRHLTTAFTSVNPAIPDCGLMQSMITRTSPLLLHNLVYAALNSRELIGDSVEDEFIIQAIYHSHPDATRSSLRSWSAKWKSAPVNLVETETTELAELPSLHYNSGTIEGTRNVHRHIMRLIGVNDEKDLDFFQSRLVLFYGDQKTVALTRAARVEMADSLSAFERRDWLLPIPALFHVQMNYIQGVMIQTHWSPQRPRKKEDQFKHSAHSILADMQFLRYKGISEDRPPFHLLDALLLESFYGRLLALFYKALKARQLFNDRCERPRESVDTLITQLTETQFRAIIQEIKEAVFSAEAWTGENSQSNTFTTMCRFVQQLKIYFILRNATRTGDIGMLRRLLPTLAFMFYGTGRTNYGLEMLYFNWLLQDTVSSSALQQAILTGSLANLKGQPNTFLPVDRVREHLNCVLKRDMNSKNSTHDWKTTFQSHPLRASSLARLKKNLERETNLNFSGKHTNKDSSFDVHSLAIKLLHDGDVDQSTYKSQTSEFLSENIILSALDKIRGKVSDFNQLYVDSNTGATLGQDLHDDDEEDENQVEMAGFTLADSLAELGDTAGFLTEYGDVE
jgi:hypothetical protein